MTREPGESTSVTALTEFLRNAVKGPSAAELDRGYHELSARLTDGERRPAARRIAWLVAFALFGLALGAAGFMASRTPVSVPVSTPVLTKIEGGKILAGGYLSESDPAGIRLFFDEGSRFVLSPGARGRLRADAEGVRLAIEHGTAALTITPHPGHRWSVEAGPFLVTVQGTDFTVSWEPSSERFELRLRRGRVAVSGPIVGEAFVLQAGQKLSVSLPNAETIISEERSDKTTDGTPPPGLANSSGIEARSETAEGAFAARGPAAPSASVRRSVAERSWRDALAKGAWDEILADAERAGIDATLEHASSDDLFALCDAARYRRRVDLARAALLSQRRRFPSSPRSIDALFLLGRVEELRAQGSAPALAFYDDYLARAPAGTYAAEALGRKMVLLKDRAGPESARAIAAEYLRRFPNGSYAGAARALERTRRTNP